MKKKITIKDKNSINNRDNSKFINEVINDAALACSDIRNEKFDIIQARESSLDGLECLGVDDGLQTMLASQMISIHKLQQTSMVFANSIRDFKAQQYYTNAAIKLSNAFTQQATLLAKLQGMASQKITVERVDVHNGGQAIVGNINSSTPNKDKK